jgi:ribonuclease P protein component
MLPTKRRIKKESFEEIMKDGLFLYSENYNLRLLDKKENIPTSFAFVVPVKVKKTSVGRHLIKRKLSYVIEKQLNNIKNNLFCLIFVKKDISLYSYEKIQKEVIELFKKAKILKEESI